MPAQAERLLPKKPFETAPRTGSFDNPLAAAAAVNSAGIVAAIEQGVA
ncbi:MAG: hypothetical protein K8S94_10665 [Planctomycetia bacterium]|nr:hypothetical protein [Planctomycetia bacterium]